MRTSTAHLLQKARRLSPRCLTLLIEGKRPLKYLPPPICWQSMESLLKGSEERAGPIIPPPTCRNPCKISSRTANGPHEVYSPRFVQIPYRGILAAGKLSSSHE